MRSLGNTRYPSESTLFAFLLLTAFLLSASPIFAQWQWQNPLPQGNGIYSAHFVNPNLGWVAVGPGGLMRTTDGGNTWEPQALPERLWAFEVFFLDESLGWVGGQGLSGSTNILFRTTNGGLTWEESLSAFGDIRTIEFINERQGWVSGQGSLIWHTTDGGLSWEEQVNVPFLINDLSFVDSLHGWGAGSPYRRVHTTDGGTTWVVDTLDHSLYGIHFIDSLRGWQCGFWKIEATTDAGKTWQVQLDTFMITWQSIFMLDADNGWVVSNGYPGSIVRTTNGGIDWTYLPNPSGMPLQDVHFTTSLNGLIVGDIATLMKTSDGGGNWETITEAVTWEWLQGIHILDQLSAWAVGYEGVIIRTLDGGIQWAVLPSGTGEILRDVYFVDSQRGWAIGHNSVILQTTDSGSSWMPQSSPLASDWADIEFSQYPTGWIVGGGKLLKSVDGGESWVDATTATLASGIRTEIEFTSPTAGWIMVGDLAFGTQQSAYRTTDGGANWTTVVSNNSDTAFLSMSFASDSVGWVSTKRNILKTEDGGDLWQRIPTPVPFGVIYFVSLQKGWAANASTGDIYATSDGGNKWVSENAPSAWILRDMKFLDSQIGWAVGSLGTVLRTTNGGTSFVEGGALVDPLPISFDIHQNYPNPFNSETTITLNLDQTAEEVVADIYDILGQRVRMLHLYPLSAGQHTLRWDGRGSNGRVLPTGAYFLRVVIDNAHAARKMLILR